VSATTHEDRAHAVLGASSSHRWMACPGSVRLSANAPRRSSRYADEGTAAHQLAERCLSGHLDAAECVGESELVNGAEWPVTDEMAEAVQVFLDAVRAAQQPGDTLLVEQQFDLSAVHEGMFGTNDACVMSPARGTLYVFDYKHGKGHAVEAVGNPQLRYYGLGALLHLGATGIRDIVLTIVQPRAPHRDGPVRSERITVMDLLEWTADLRAAAVATEDVFAPIRAGEWCSFCPAAGACPALRDRALESAMADFSGATITVPAEPALLDPADLARLLDGADLIDKWLAAVRAHALHLAESGQAVPGYKLVDKRATRKWRDPAQVPQALSALGVPPAEMYKEPELRSPAQIETLVPGKNKKERETKIAALVEKISSGVNLVRDADPRGAREASAVADFASVL
jgi:hypothetical protein